MITFEKHHVEELYSHAREVLPAECCGLLGGTTKGKVLHVYRLKNVADDRLSAYEAAPEELFSAQRSMREAGEQLIGIYHSHPRSCNPVPSDTDLRLAFYPEAAYFIIGFENGSAFLRGFRIDEQQRTWSRVEYQIA